MQYSAGIWGIPVCPKPNSYDATEAAQLIVPGAPWSQQQLTPQQLAPQQQPPQQQQPQHQHHQLQQPQPEPELWATDLPDLPAWPVDSGSGTSKLMGTFGGGYDAALGTSSPLGLEGGLTPRPAIFTPAGRIPGFGVSTPATGTADGAAELHSVEDIRHDEFATSGAHHAPCPLHQLPRIAAAAAAC